MMQTSVAHTGRQTGSFRYLSLDMWRGVACLLVVLFHAASTYLASARGIPRSTVAWLTDSALRLMNYGRAGVPLFFVISGYCIAATARTAQERQLPITTYFARRFRRIYPPYWIALALLVAFYLVCDVPHSVGMTTMRLQVGEIRPWWFDASQWLGNLTLTETWRYHVAGSPFGHIIFQSWTLCYEEQFYFVVGALLLFGRRAFFVSCAAVTVATLLIQQSAAAEHIDISGVFFDGYWFAFAFGIGVFYASNHLQSLGKAAMSAAIAASGALFLVLPGLDSRRFGLTPALSLAIAAAFAVALIYLRTWDHTIYESRWLRPLRTCGAMCYSLYLVHGVIVVAVGRFCYDHGVRSATATLLLTVPLCVACALAVGWRFHIVVERRFINAPAPRIASASVPVVVRTDAVALG